MRWPWKRRQAPEPEPEPVIWEAPPAVRSLHCRMKAESKLIESLNPEQLYSFRMRGCFFVRSLQSGRIYKISRGISGNISRVDPPASFCFHLNHPEHVFPIADHVLAQALMIRYSEKEFLRIARKTNL